MSGGKHVTGVIRLYYFAHIFPANATLFCQLADSEGNFQAYYDSGANLTWLADASAVVVDWNG